MILAFKASEVVEASGNIPKGVNNCLREVYRPSCTGTGSNSATCFVVRRVNTLLSIRDEEILVRISGIASVRHFTIVDVSQLLPSRHRKDDSTMTVNTAHARPPENDKRVPFRFPGVEPGRAPEPLNTRTTKHRRTRSLKAIRERITQVAQHLSSLTDGYDVLPRQGSRRPWGGLASQITDEKVNLTMELLVDSEVAAKHRAIARELDKDIYGMRETVVEFGTAVREGWRGPKMDMEKARKMIAEVRAARVRYVKDITVKQIELQLEKDKAIQVLLDLAVLEKLMEEGEEEEPQPEDSDSDRTLTQVGYVSR